MTSRSTVVKVGERLPVMSATTTDGRTIDLHQARGSCILVFPHARCDDCHAYLRRLDAVAREVALWGGQSLALVAAGEEARALAGDVSLWVIGDGDGRMRAAAGLTVDEAAVLVTDRFGSTYLSASTGPEHRFPEPKELVDEVRFIGIQCPECGVPDEPPLGL